MLRARYITLVTLILVGLFFPHVAQAVDFTEIPLNTGYILQSAPAVIDFDGNGHLEIVAGSFDGRVTVLTNDGTNYSILWQKNMADYLTPYTQASIHGGIAAGDLDGNGVLEMVVATGGLPVHRDRPGAILVFTYVGGADVFALMPGWPRFAFNELGGDSVPDGFASTPALGNIDSDPNLEIVIGGMDRRLHAWHHNGQYVAGWPVDRSKNYYRDPLSSPALVDLTGDGILEVIIGTNMFKDPLCRNPYLFYGLKGDGTFLPGFPVETTQNVASSPAIGDINGDGQLDIIFGTGTYSEACNGPANGKKVYAVDLNGRPLPGWPKATDANMETSPALGDLDGDNVPEVVIPCFDYRDLSCRKLYAWHGDGSAVGNFPVQLPDLPLVFQSPILADIDNDNAVEILLAAADALLIYGPDGQLEERRVEDAGDHYVVNPVVADVDNDGLLETIIGSGTIAPASLGIWQETGTVDGAQPWPMFHRESSRKGVQPMVFEVKAYVYLPLVTR